MFSHTAEYALRVVVHLAGLKDRPTTTRQIAAATRIPEGYLAKVLQSLVHAGMVQSQRGLHGGFILGKNASELTLLDVISVVDAPARIMHCPINVKEHETSLCALHRRLDGVLLGVENALRGSTIADVITDCTCCKPLVNGSEVVAVPLGQPVAEENSTGAA